MAGIGSKADTEKPPSLLPKFISSMLNPRTLVLPLLFVLGAASSAAQEANPEPVQPFRLIYEGTKGPGLGRHVVLIAGDEEYRSEEVLPMLGRILAFHHGFRCTVLFSTDPKTGVIDPKNQTHIPGMEVLAQADMVVLFTRFRELPDADMKYFVDYVESGKPILGIRTATHAFNYSRNKESPYAHYSFRDKDWPGGFGRQILGETWVNHHGAHGIQSTRGIIEPYNKEHPILRGVDDVWGTTDVYGIRSLPKDARVLLRGQVLTGMKPDSPILDGPKNVPMMPVFWVREIPREGSEPTRIACTTLGAAPDFVSSGVRRYMVNTCYWGLGMEDKISATSKVEMIGSFPATEFGFGKSVKGVRPEDHSWPLKK